MSRDVGMAGRAGMVGHPREVVRSALVIGMAGGARSNLGGELQWMVGGRAVAGLTFGFHLPAGFRRGQPGVVLDGRERHVAGRAVVFPLCMHGGHRPRRVVPWHVDRSPGTPADSEDDRYPDQPAASALQGAELMEVGAVDP